MVLLQEVFAPFRHVASKHAPWMIYIGLYGCLESESCEELKHVKNSTYCSKAPHLFHHDGWKVYAKIRHFSHKLFLLSILSGLRKVTNARVLFLFSCTLSLCTSQMVALNKHYGCHNNNVLKRPQLLATWTWRGPWDVKTIGPQGLCSSRGRACILQWFITLNNILRGNIIGYPWSAHNKRSNLSFGFILIPPQI